MKKPGVRRRFVQAAAQALEPRTLFGAGDLDPTFNDHGLSELDLPSVNLDQIVTQSDSKIVLAGTIGKDDDQDFFLARFNADGTADTTFGDGGTIRTDFGGADALHDIAVDAQDRIIVCGSGGSGIDFAVARYTKAGALDQSFSGDGRTLIPFGGDDGAGFVLRTPGNTITLIGGTSSGSGMAAARLNANGGFDTNFAGDGSELLEFELDPNDVEWGFAPRNISAVTLASNGVIVLDGGATNGDLVRNFSASVNPDGSTSQAYIGGVDDTSIVASARNRAGQNVFVEANYTIEPVYAYWPPFENPDDPILQHDASQILVGKDDKFILLGTAIGGHDIFLSRVTSNGENLIPDPGFGDAGVSRPTFASEFGYTSVVRGAIDPQGRIVVLNFASREVDSGYFLARFDVTGSDHPSPVTISSRGTMTITGTSSSDRIAFSTYGDAVEINGIAIPFDPTTVRRIHIDAGGGDDTVNANIKRPCTVLGGDRNDVLLASQSGSYIEGGTGNDTVTGSIGRDYLVGGDGNDLLEGADGKDTVSGDGGNDIINGGNGNDTIHGGDGADTIVGGRGRDRIYGEAGDDQLLARDRARDTLYGGDGTDEATVDSSGTVKDLWGEIESLL